MSIWDKVSKTAKDTMSTIGSKSSEMLEIGKLKIRINQSEDRIISKKKEIGSLVYEAYVNNAEPEKEAIIAFINEIKSLEIDIKETKEQITLIQQ